MTLTGRGQREQRQAQALWCIGLESGADSGWPGTDWIEDIVLRQSGPDVYDQWVRRAQVKWTDPAIKSAFGDVRRRRREQLRRRAIRQRDQLRRRRQPAVHRSARLPVPPPGQLHHRLLQDSGRRDGRRLRLLPHARTSTRRTRAPSTGAGDLFGMFNDTPQARSLMAYLVTAEAQDDLGRDRWRSVRQQERRPDYPDERRQAIRRDPRPTPRSSAFDASRPDAVGDERGAFFRAIVEFVQNPGQPRLDPGQPRHRPGRRLFGYVGSPASLRASDRYGRPSLDSTRGGAFDGSNNSSPRLIVVIGVPAVLVGYILLTEQVLRAVPDRQRGRIRPWLWLATRAWRS